MLKVRVIPVLLVQDGLLKKPVQFKNPRTVANPLTIVRVFEERQVDELILLDIGVTVDNDEIDPQLVRDISEELTVPFAFGGGVNSTKSMTEIIQAGAEKVVLNSASVENPSLISEGANKFGSQCIVVSIDALRLKNGYKVFIKSGSVETSLDPVEWAKEVELRGAGEILINSISHEGMMQGYDLELIKMITESVSIPVIAAGGASCLQDFVDVVKKCNASAVGAGSMYHYTKYTPNMIKGILKDNNVAVRVYPDINYKYDY